VGNALPVIALIVGAVLGGAVAWLLLKAKISGAVAILKAELQPQIATLNERVSAKDSEVSRLQAELEVAQQRQRGLAKELDDERTARASLEEKSNRVASLERELGSLRTELGGQKEENIRLAEKARTSEESLAIERKQIEDLQQKFQKDFEAVANKLLIDNSSRFGQQSAADLEKLLKPLQVNLQEFKTRIDKVHQESMTNHALLKEQVGRIGTEAANLSRALKGEVKVMGSWGENMLDQILAKSGLQEGVHYRRQHSAKNEAGEQRYLDVVIELPEDNHLVIDSKVSLKAYEEYVNCADDAARQLCLDAHIRSIRNHVRGLSAKRYQETHGIRTPDFVLMYIPIEMAFFAAVGQEPGLFSEALERNVVLITNSTLLATLRTVANVWRLADQQKHAMEIADRGGKLYDKFVGFVSDLQSIGASLKQSQQTWDEACKKLSTGPGNLVRQAQQLKDMGANASKSLPAEWLETGTLTNSSVELDGAIPTADAEPPARLNQPTLGGLGIG
jgi:DNA recombination protein RmuC